MQLLHLALFCTETTVGFVPCHYALKPVGMIVPATNCRSEGTLWIHFLKLIVDWSRSLTNFTALGYDKTDR